MMKVEGGFFVVFVFLFVVLRAEEGYDEEREEGLVDLGSFLVGMD